MVASAFDDAVGLGLAMIENIQDKYPLSFKGKQDAQAMADLCQEYRLTIVFLNHLDPNWVWIG
jgi:hypothetical protein